MSGLKKTVIKEMVLGTPAQTTIEDFILTQLGSEAETDFELSGAADASLIAGASLVWQDDGEGGTRVQLSVRFEKEGTWSPA